MFPPLLQWLMYASVAMALAMLVYQIRGIVREIRATRELVRLQVNAAVHGIGSRVEMGVVWRANVPSAALRRPLAAARPP